MKIIYVILISFIVLSCKKNSASNTVSPPQNDLQSQLSGNWRVIQYVVSNFNTTAGRPYIPNDTIIPVHTETYVFSKDSLFTDTWQTNGYNYTTNPYTFENSQTKEFTGTHFCTYSKGYFVNHLNSFNDTSLINSISATKLVISDNVPVTYNPSTGILYTITTSLQR
jgi:hypothetical protein